jgi:hypothetical protein
VFVNSRAHGIALPPWPESKTEEDYFLGFQKWADNIRQTHKELTHPLDKQAQNITAPPTNTPKSSTRQLTYTNNTQSYEFEEQMVTLAGYCVHSTVIPAIVPKTIFATSEEIDGKELLFSNGGGCYGKRGKQGR